MKLGNRIEHLNKKNNNQQQDIERTNLNLNLYMEKLLLVVLLSL
jgi:hypothetical protein